MKELRLLFCLLAVPYLAIEWVTVRDAAKEHYSKMADEAWAAKMQLDVPWTIQAAERDRKEKPNE